MLLFFHGPCTFATIAHHEGQLFVLFARQFHGGHLVSVKTLYSGGEYCIVANDVLDAHQRSGRPQAKQVVIKRKCENALSRVVHGVARWWRSLSFYTDASRHTHEKKSVSPFINTRMKGIAVKKNPGLWERCKREACSKAGLCKHSARKMQWATRCYKKHGGRYASPRKSADNRLARWTRQRWRTYDGKPSRGRTRYLPADAWKRLTPDQVRRTNRAKARGYSRGKQWVRQPSDVARIASHVRRRTSNSKRRS